MTHAAKLAREDAITDALRAANDAIGAEQPTPQAFRIIAALKQLREQISARVQGSDRVDYMERVQEAARGQWYIDHAKGDGHIRIGPEHDALAGVETPLGRLVAVVWRVHWKGQKRGDRVCWAGEYYLNNEPITVAEIRAAGLARRPTTRNRQKKEPAR